MKHKQQGLTLLDVLVAMVLVGLLSTVLMTSAAGLVRTSGSSEDLFRAQVWMDELERLSLGLVASMPPENWPMVRAQVSGYNYIPPRYANNEPEAEELYVSGWQQRVIKTRYVDIVADTLFSPADDTMVTDILRVDAVVWKPGFQLVQRTWLLFRPRD